MKSIILKTLGALHKDAVLVSPGVDGEGYGLSLMHQEVTLKGQNLFRLGYHSLQGFVLVARRL